MAKNIDGSTQVRTFKMKKGVGVPEKFDGAEIRIRLASDTDNAEQAFANMLALTDGNVQAVVDMFNSAAALDVQKTVKAGAKEEATVGDLQKIADEHTIKPNVRGRGETSGKAAVTKAKAQKFEAVQDAANAALDDLRKLAGENPDLAKMQLGLMQRLGVIPADVTLESLTA